MFSFAGLVSLFNQCLHYKHTFFFFASNLSSLGCSHIGLGFISEDQKNVGSWCQLILKPLMLTLFMMSWIWIAGPQVAVPMAMFLWFSPLIFNKPDHNDNLSNVDFNKPDHKSNENLLWICFCSISIEKTYNASLLGVPFKGSFSLLEDFGRNFNHSFTHLCFKEIFWSGD